MADSYQTAPAAAESPDSKSAKPDKDKLADIHRQAMKRYREAEDADRDNRVKAMEDLRFRWSDDHWTHDDRADRKGRPCLTINRMPQFVRQVTGDIRQNKPAIKVRPVEDADKQLSDYYSDRIRHIEQESDADTAYVTGADCAATCGIGWWRVNVEYKTGKTFTQQLRVERIMNPFAVVDDPLANKLDRCDSRYRFVVDRMARDEFKNKYPNATVSDFDIPQEQRAAIDVAWFTDDRVRIAEYWVKDTVTTTIVEMPDGSALEQSEAEQQLPGWLATKPRTRTLNADKIVQYIISGAEVLEGPHEWAGSMFPIVPVIGEEGAIGEKIVRHGMVRMAKDAQRAFNYMRSTSVEVVAMQPKTPFLVTIDQIKGLEGFWDNAGRKPYPWLPYNPDLKAPGPPQRVQPPTSATGLMAEAGLAADDMKAVIGIYDASLGNRSNETSGRAIVAREKQGDTGTFVYTDNLSKAIAHTGRVLMDLLPKIEDTEQTVQTLAEDKTTRAYRINKMVRQGDGLARIAQPIPSQEEMQKPNFVPPPPIPMPDDMSYSVEVTTGPSYATKRLEAADSMIQFAQAVPAAAAVMPDLIATAMDWPSSEQIAKRLRKTLPPDIDDDTQRQPPPPDPLKVAQAAKYMSEAKGNELDNDMKEIQLAGMIPAIQQAVVQAVAQGLMQMLRPPPGQQGPMPMAPNGPQQMAAGAPFPSGPAGAMPAMPGLAGMMAGPPRDDQGGGGAPPVPAMAPPPY